MESSRRSFLKKSCISLGAVALFDLKGLGSPFVTLAQDHQLSCRLQRLMRHLPKKTDPELHQGLVLPWRQLRIRRKSRSHEADRSPPGMSQPKTSPVPYA